jgi:hypothetical protein
MQTVIILREISHIKRPEQRSNANVFITYHVLAEAGATFNNYFFDNSFGFLRQFKNRSFLDPVFVHVTGRSQN